MHEPCTSRARAGVGLDAKRINLSVARRKCGLDTRATASPSVTVETILFRDADAHHCFVFVFLFFKSIVSLMFLCNRVMFSIHHTARIKHLNVSDTSDQNSGLGLDF